MGEEPLAETRLAISAQRTELERTADQLRDALDFKKRFQENPALFVGLGAGAVFLVVGGPIRVAKLARRRLFRSEPEKAYDALPKVMQKWVDDMSGTVGPRAVGGARDAGRMSSSAGVTIRARARRSSPRRWRRDRPVRSEPRGTPSRPAPPSSARRLPARRSSASSRPSLPRWGRAPQSAGSRAPWTPRLPRRMSARLSASIRPTDPPIRASGGTADAPALGAGVARRASSNLASPTTAHGS